MTLHQKRYRVLLVEDNPGDVRLTQEAFKECGNKVDLEVVMDGVEALSFLKKEGVYADKTTPDLILLDLNLPKWDGRQVLQKIKNDDALLRIPVVVLTTSNAAADVLKSYDLYANCFVSKPINFDDFLKIINHIQLFWLETAILPSKIN